MKFLKRTNSNRVLVCKNCYSSIPSTYSDIFAANPFATVRKTVSAGLDLTNYFTAQPARAMVQKAVNVNPITSKPVKPVAPIRPEFTQAYTELESRITATPPERKPSEAELAALEALTRIKADLERISSANDVLASKGIRPTSESDLQPAGTGNAHALRMYSGQLLQRMFGGGSSAPLQKGDRSYGNTANQSRRPGALSL